MNKSGDKDKITSVNFQPFTNPSIKPPKNVATYCIVLPNLSPKPSFTLFTSLKKKETKIKWHEIENKLIENLLSQTVCQLARFVNIKPANVLFQNRLE